MEVLEEHLDQRIDRESQALELERHGDAVITVGEALLGMDLILVCFVDIGFRTGSLLFFWWVIAEGVLGVILMVVGSQQKSLAKKRLAALEPNRSGAE